MREKGGGVINMPLKPSNINGESVIEAMINELERRGLEPEAIAKAKKILSDKSSKSRILEFAKIDKEIIEKATEIKNKIDTELMMHQKLWEKDCLKITLRPEGLVIN